MTKKLLIVDDDASGSDMYRMRFEVDKWEVKQAFSSEEAMVILKEENYLPDVILLDLVLPKMQGSELLGIIKKDDRTKDVVVIILTALMLNSADQERISKGADDYIMKINILPHELVERVEKLLKKKGIKV